ncbi:MAG: FkbM family methyltransferase [Dehalococcoidia bacterium]|nr:FkbM family methyltransferase [Dehalococcoidia bacterium]
MKINLPGRNAPSTITVNLLMHGVWERFQTKLFKDSIHEGMVVVDIGAHIGYYTLLAAERVGKNGAVFAFEPDESNYDLLIKNIEQNEYSNVTPVKKAVTSSTGTVKLFLNARESGEHSIIEDKRRQKVVLVDSVALDDFLDADCAVDVIKMDVEGAEMAALLGMSKVIARSPRLAMFTEFFPGALERAGVSPADYFNELQRHEFNIYLIDEPRQLWEAVSDIAYLANYLMRKKIRGINLLCVKGSFMDAGVFQTLGKTGV